MKRNLIIIFIVLAVAAVAYLITHHFLLNRYGYDWDETRQIEYARKLFNKNKFDAHSSGLYQILAEKDNTEGMYMYGVALRHTPQEEAGDSIDDIYGRGLTWIKRAAEAGFDKAQFYMGIHYYNFDRKNTDGIRWLRAAAEQGHREAEYFLGIACLEGYVDDGIEEGIRLLRRSAGQGFSNASSTLGNILIEGQYGQPKNVNEGFKWIRYAAEDGNLSAMETLGSLYLKGRGVRKDTELAMKWLKRAADAEEKYYGSSRIRSQYGLD